MNPVEFAQSWYRAQANGTWEHAHGITIETLDSPGWMVTIDLVETPLEGRSMTAVRQERSALDWIVCEVEQNRFRGQGDTEKLLPILRVFQDWASGNV